jgi:hypothetical protein
VSNSETRTTYIWFWFVEYPTDFGFKNIHSLSKQK